MRPNRRAWRAPLDLPAFDAAAAFSALAPGGVSGFLIERAGPDGHPETACLGAEPSATIRLVDGRLKALGARLAPAAGSPIETLGRTLRELRAADRGPAWAGGAVGYLAYEAVRHLERLSERPDAAEEGVFFVFDEAVLHDYRTGRTEFVAWCPAGAGFKAAARVAASRAAALERLLRGVPAPKPLRLDGGRGRAPTGALGPANFRRAVERIREHIRAGDIFQCVLSEQFRVPSRASGLSVYRALRALNPSPYHFLLRDGRREYVGASPERLVRVEGGRVLYSPIAGTRPRGKTGAEDRRLEAALRRSPKEKAEHLMLVDLGRNDVGRVCAPGSVTVRRYMDVRRFSSVMHLVSEIEGRLEPDRTAWDALSAAFPAGTVTGAPKVRAMEILAGLEPRARGFYSGAVVQLDPLGNLDSCIALRSLRLDGREAVLQAGAGIVADSRPEREWQEVLHKLEAGRVALAAAERL